MCTPVARRRVARQHPRHRILPAGGQLVEGSAVQQHYVSANYTHALDVLIEQKPNLILQLLATEDDRLSLSCNTDITSDLLALRRRGQIDFAFVRQVHPDLPFMPRPAEIETPECAGLVRTRKKPHDLFSVVKRPVGLQDHAIALHVSRLIRDGGSLQIGIGEIGDAVAHALILRQRQRIAPIWDACPFPLSDAFAETASFAAIALRGALRQIAEQGSRRDRR